MSNIILVTGGRNYQNRQAVYEALDKQHARVPVGILIHGGAYGADNLAADWAHARGIHAAEVLPLWDYYGKAAGHLRNVAMASLRPDILNAFPGGKGTASMIRIAHDLGIMVERVEE